MINEVTSCEVKIFDKVVGVIYKPKDSNYATFEYNDNFIKQELQISPITMPLSKRIYTFPSLSLESFNGLPGVFSDSLPDAFGNTVIDEYLKSVGRNKGSMNAIEKLCYEGTRGMGALEYFPVINHNYDVNSIINVNLLSEFANDILNNKNIEYINEKDINRLNLLSLGASAGGARAKAVVAYNSKKNIFKSGQVMHDDDYEYYIIKFDKIDENGEHGEIDNPEYTSIEYAYYLMAKDLKIDIAECKMLELEGKKHFMSKRFDRVLGDDGTYKKMHMTTFAGIRHIDYRVPHSTSYEELAFTTRQLNKSEYYQEQIFRRMAFNVYAYNMDDHPKNFSFLMDENGEWTLAPQYDLTFSYKKDSRWVSNHQMTINEKFSHITDDDLLKAAEAMDLSNAKSKKIIEDTKKVISRWEEYADMAGISEANSNYIKNMTLSV